MNKSMLSEMGGEVDGRERVRGEKMEATWEYPGFSAPFELVKVTYLSRLRCWEGNAEQMFFARVAASGCRAVKTGGQRQLYELAEPICVLLDSICLAEGVAWSIVGDSNP